jgi:hypothetical protein
MNQNLTINPESCKPHRNSIFDQFPYDIRAIIYFYLQSEDLPPLAPDPNCVNFLLSCHAAKQEVDDLSSRRHAPFFASFKESTGVEVQIRHDRHSPRSLIAVIPYAAFKTSDLTPRRLGWKREIMIALHPLFSQTLDSIRIHIASEISTSPQLLSLVERAEVELSIHAMLRDAGYMIERVRRAHEDPVTSPPGSLRLETMFGYMREGQSALYPSAPVKAKRICISRDLRGSEQGIEMQLNGKMHHALQNAESTNKPMDPHHLPVAMFYHLRDAERLAGEMGLISANRWSSTHAEPLSLNTLVNGIHVENESYASSEGLGREVKEGLTGTSAEEFEEQESEVSRVVWDT